MTHSLSQTLGQVMRLEQRLTPQLIQSMNILQLPSMALENRVAEELERNYALEVVEPVAREQQPGTQTESRTAGSDGEIESFNRFERLAREYGSDDLFGGSYKSRRAAPATERDAKMDAMANAASRPESLAEHLLSQWAVIDCSETIRRAGEAIIYCLEDDGYLKVRLDEVVDRAKPPVSVEDLEEALKLVQQLDPVGVAARDYQECLLLQLDAMRGDNRIEKELVRNHLQDVIRNRYPAIERATGFSVGEIAEAVKAMQSALHLHPGYLVVEREAPRINPDVIVEQAENGAGFDVRLTRGNSPNLRVSHSALRMLKDKNCTKDVRDFVRQHIESASSLIDAIKFRRERLLAVAQRIVECQSEFFDVGPEALNVLRMSTLAEELECDPSTISRTVAGKYMQTPRGIYPLRYFFTGGTTTSNGETTSWDSVKAAVKKIVDEEDKRSPIHDEKIAEMLHEKGIDISRRTVAKYRQQLDIPAARQRRVF